MKNNLLIGLVLVALLVIAGCSTSDERQSGIFGDEGNSGDSSSSGVTLEFAQGNPSNEIFKGNEVTFAFVFRNYQEHEIQNLKMRTSGFDRGFVSGLDESYSIQSISSASDAAGPGVYSGLVEESVVVDGFTGNYDFNPEFTYCYETTSTHQEALCVPNTQNQCETDFEQSSSSNGPLGVSVSSINAVEGDVLVRFNVENSGPGEVVNECFNTQDYATSYGVQAMLGTQQGECSPIGSEEFLLSNGQSGTFQCRFSRTSQDSYSTQLNVELTNTYQQSKRKEISVVDLNQ